MPENHDSVSPSESRPATSGSIFGGDSRFHSDAADPSEATVDEYRSLSVAAIISLGLGLLAALAFFFPSLWVLTLIGILVSFATVVVLQRNDRPPAGVSLALAGLSLSTISAAALPAANAAHRVASEADIVEYGYMFFEMIRHDKLIPAYELTCLPVTRMSWTRKDIWEQYAKEEESVSLIRQFANRPEIRALDVLGDEALVRFFAMDAYESQTTRDVFWPVYAVTFRDPETDEQKSFFVRLKIAEYHQVQSETSSMQILDVEGGIRPHKIHGGPSPLED